MGEPPSRRLQLLGLALPAPPSPVGSYSAAVADGSTVYVSGQVVTEDGRAVSPGLVGREVAPERARELAGRAALQGLAAVAQLAGSIDRVEAVLRVGVFVASAPGFDRQHEVANGATDLVAELFPGARRPARAAVGVAGLPLNAPVEVEMVARTVRG